MSRGIARRQFVFGLAAAGGASAFGLPGMAAAQLGSGGDAAAHAHDWDWLEGSWDVWHRRLRQRLAGSDAWDEFPGKSVLWKLMGGFGTIDDNMLHLPNGLYRGLGLRAFDPVARRWSIWWLDGRNAGRMDPPVVGGFEGDSGTFVGADTFEGRPIIVRFRWFDINGPRPHWEQAFSPDGGATWEINWRNFFTRTTPEQVPLPPSPDAPRHWDFLVGRWTVRHRRLKQRLAGSTQWEEFGGTLHNWPVLGGFGNVGDNVLELPSGTYRGASVRAFDPAAGLWSSWWLDGRTAATLAPPLQGTLDRNGGTLLGDDLHEGRAVKVRVRWLRLAPDSIRWEQAYSADGGASWEVNWVSDFARQS
ncbi:hypothetical protein [Sphingosinicella sp. CPCC 101087]|uniref:hypothetical protein n=1 Tax=Sphingosinicella sp. CPCC 101087 TaxID=2497754 RepID=UPI00197F486C|nr:hypothetical protein [Sphingosinicella sp. CPCC 101087]